MKKKHVCVVRYILAGSVALINMISIQAQVSNPSTWYDFVNGNENPIVTDTFRTQSLLKQSTDNWSYTTAGGAILPVGKRTLTIPPGGSASFASFPIDNYQDVVLQFRLAGINLMEGESLQINYLDYGMTATKTLFDPKDATTFNYKQIRITGSPTSLDIYSNPPATNTQGGAYYVNSFAVFGSIPQYSLFSGSGNWNDTTRWSHLPPLRRRSALINGSAEVDSPVQCGLAVLGNGSVHIAEKGHFSVDTLVLYKTDISLTVAGELTIREQLALRYTFPEKGKWYFLSFPFDVRMEGVDKRFQLKGETFSGEGDYLYVQVYDGNKRAYSEEATGNWSVLSEVSENELVFERGKGYLVALDAAASDHTLTFSTGYDQIPAGFGQTASISVDAPSVTTVDEAHYGWSLCGNPLPSPLSLSQIASDPALDGNIYLYDGNHYTAYPLGGDYVLPPFSAFFVKASAGTEIKLTSGTPPAHAARLKADHTLYAGAEPQERALHTSSLYEETTKSLIKGKALYLFNLPASGRVYVSDFTGRLVYRHAVSPGSSTLSLPLQAGSYIVRIVAGSYCVRHRCMLIQ